MNKNSRVFDFLQYQLERFPKSDMLTGKENGRWVTHSTAEIKELVDTLSTGLLSLGITGRDMNVEHQDKIAIISRNRPEWIILDLACQQIGAILCPVYPTTNVKELEFIFNDAEIKYVFISGQDILDKVNSIREHVPSLVNVYSFDRLPKVDYWKKILNLSQPEHFTKLRDVKNSILTSHCATIIYTSGTTGTPKGVMLSHKNIVMNLINSRKTFPFKDDIKGRALSFLPLNHIFERMVTYIYITSGVSIYYAESMDTIADNLREVKPTIFCTVPRLLEKVYEKIMAKGAEQKGIKKSLFFWAVGLGTQYDNKVSGGFLYNIQLAIANKLVFSKWREALGGNVTTIVTGSAACQVRLLRIFTAAKIPIFEGYGPTENSPVISVNCQLKGGTKFGTVGLVIKGQQVKIEADGEICVKGPSVMMGYYKNPKLTAETIIDGWLHTGDIGVFEDDKYLKITDRKKELFKTSGGKYVAPQPIENKMKESPFIEQMMVVGEGEKFVGALIVPAMPTLKDWMKNHEIEFTTVKAALHHPKVQELYNKTITKFNNDFNHVEQVKKFELLEHEWTIESGELTPTLKLKRKVIMAECKDAIEKIYKSEELVK
jgi:long-chain acyl-CoA synthetase